MPILLASEFPIDALMRLGISSRFRYSWPSHTSSEQEPTETVEFHVFWHCPRTVPKPYKIKCFRASVFKIYHDSLSLTGDAET